MKYILQKLGKSTSFLIKKKGQKTLHPANKIERKQFSHAKKRIQLGAGRGMHYC